MNNNDYYCLSRKRPLFRGVLHLYMTLVIFMTFPFLMANCEDCTADDFWAVLISTLASIVCYYTSALYHVVEWSSVENEDTFGYFDELGVLLMMGFHTFPVLNRLDIGFAVPTVALGLIALSIKIDKVRKEFYVFLFMVGVYQMFQLDGAIFSLWMVAGLSYAIGYTIFTFKLFDYQFNTDIFGYHEIFHSFTCLSHLFIIFANYLALT